jgi:glyoxylase-like metal-dependent hydrolase (beta-lactamase superfamily II)
VRQNLTTIYITHAHGDHFLGLKLLLDAFPLAKAFATASAIPGLQYQIKPEFVSLHKKSPKPANLVII